MRDSEKQLFRAHGGGLIWWLLLAALMLLPASVPAISTTVTWVPSTATNVAGYTLYYGTGSRNYTQSVSVSTNQALVSGLAPGTTYFFAAKSDDAAGNQSAYSNEATFAGYSVAPGNRLTVKTTPATNTDQLTFSLNAGAPATATVNPTNGTVFWSPDYSYANTTNSIGVTVTDLTNPSASRQMTLVVTVGDYLILTMPSVPAQTGQSANLPFALAASDGVTNLSFNLAWPAQSLQNPTLNFTAPIAGGTLQNLGNTLAIQLWTANGNTINSTNSFASLNFSVAADQTSAFISLPASAVTATKSSGSAFANVSAQAAEVVVIGASPLLRPTAGNGTRTLTLYANPGTNYELDCATNLIAPIQWQSVQNFQPTNLQQSIALDPSAPVIFYRLTQL